MCTANSINMYKIWKQWWSQIVCVSTLCQCSHSTNSWKNLDGNTVLRIHFKPFQIRLSLGDELSFLSLNGEHIVLEVQSTLLKRTDQIQFVFWNINVVEQLISINQQSGHIKTVWKFINFGHISYTIKCETHESRVTSKYSWNFNCRAGSAFPSICTVIQARPIYTSYLIIVSEGSKFTITWVESEKCNILLNIIRQILIQFCVNIYI